MNNDTQLDRAGAAIEAYTKAAIDTEGYREDMQTLCTDLIADILLYQAGNIIVPHQ